MLILDLLHDKAYKNTTDVHSLDFETALCTELGLGSSKEDGEALFVRSMYYRQCRSFFAELQQWEKFKRIYSIDPDFYKDLSKTEEIVLDYKLMARLPFDTFYIDLSSVQSMSTNHFEKVAGVLVNTADTGKIHMTVIDADNRQYNPYYCDNIKDFAQKYGLYYGPCRFVDVWLDQDKTDNKISKKSKELLSCLGWQVEPGSVISTIDICSKVMGELILFTIQFLYFLHSQNTDIEPARPEPTRPYKNVGKAKAIDTAAGVSQWNVGVRYGEKLRAIDKKQKLYGDIVGGYTRNRPRPYVRRAHWHRYWCGPENDRTLEPRWVQPVFCNGTVDDIATSINEVTNKDATGSAGEELVKAYLEKYHVEYEAEYAVVINGHRRRYDFRIIHDNKEILIEFDGEQHFSPIEQFGGIKQFRERQAADRDKNKYARKNRIPLLRIRYDQKANIPELIDAFLDKPTVHQYNPMLSNAAYYAA